MKKIILLLLLFNITSTIFSQNIKEKDERIPFVIVQKIPIYKGCKSNINQKKCTQDSIKAHFYKNINFTEEIGLESGKKRIVTQFIINKDGSVTSVKTRAPHQKIILETERITKLLPQFIAGKQNGKPVTVIYNLPILFKIENNISFDNAILFSDVDETPMLDNQPITKKKYKLPRYYFNQFILNNYNPDVIASVSKNSNLPFINSKFTFKILIDKYGKINKAIVSEILLNTDSLTYEIKDVLSNKDIQGEAFNIMQKFPKLKPGKHNNENVNVRLEIQITFSSDIEKLKLRQKKYKINSERKKIIFDTFPAFSNCKGSNDKLKQCFYKKMNNHFHKHFDRDILVDTKVANGKKRVHTRFTINEKGVIINIKARSPHPKLTRETIRILKLLPNMTPAKYKNKPTEIHLNFPFIFNLGKKSWIEKKRDDKKQRDKDYYNKFGHY